MAATRLTPAVSAFRCPRCRASILNSFASLPSPATASSVGTRWQFAKQVQERRLHQTSSRRQENDDIRAAPGAERVQSRPTKSDLDALEESFGVQPKKQKQPVQEQESQLATTPWYLNEQPQEPEVNPFAERQRIPELPEYPPPILEPLLKQLSIDLGFDYLSIIDLRRVDPPPAFGTNLIMLFGSARSEKHLNVSADRLCRWLRTTYQLNPYADGLLGRNELKLKLKRKNKRSKIMSAAGAYAGNDPDDGIATGWVCVNVGEVEGGIIPGSPQDPIDQPGFIGFGTRSLGAKIVIQMMTEVKRGEVDLESLWQGMVDKAKRVEAGERRAREKEEQRLLEESQREPSAFDPLESDKWSASSPSRQQTRGFHTAARRMVAEVSSLDNSHGTLEGAEAMPLPPRDEETPSQAREEETSSSSPQALYEELLSRPPSAALEALGTNEDDHTSTPFLRSLNESTPLFRSLDDLLASVEIHCLAINLGHPGYTRIRLLRLLREIQATGAMVPEETCHTALKTVLTAHNVHAEHDYSGVALPAKAARAIIRSCLRYAKSVMDIMEAHSYPINTREIFEQLHYAVSFPRFSHENDGLVPSLQRPSFPYSPADLSAAYAGQPTESGPSLPGVYGIPRHELSAGVRAAIDEHYEPAPSHSPLGYDASLYKLMLATYATHGDYSAFWTLWTRLPGRMLARDADMYVIMLRMVAAGGDSGHAREFLMLRVPEMADEEPPVLIQGEVARALRECLLVADTRPGMGEPWKRWWVRVHAALGDDGLGDDALRTTALRDV